jgi:predicted nucleic acid-binding protein
MEDKHSAFLDTSYIVRYLTNDPPPMAKIAEAVIDSDQPLIISALILAESAYVLSVVYEVPRSAVIDALMSLIQRQNIQLLNLPKPLVLKALLLCRDSNRHSFADVLLWAEAYHRNAPGIYTFDKRFPIDGLERLGVDWSS